MAAVSRRLRLGRGLHSRENGRGQEGQTPQTRKRGGGAPFLSSPQDPCANRNREAAVGVGLQESLSGKSLAPGGLGGWSN